MKRWAVKWTDARGRTGVGDAFETREQAEWACTVLRDECGSMGMRYDVLDLQQIRTALADHVAKARRCLPFEGDGLEWPGSAVDPLDVMYDGISLRVLVMQYERGQQERGAHWRHEAKCWTPAQHAAVSAHWSAELRGKIAETTERDRSPILVDLQEES